MRHDQASNDSSSQASICAGCLSLMVTGVPIKAPKVKMKKIIQKRYQIMLIKKNQK